MTVSSTHNHLTPPMARHAKPRETLGVKEVEVYLKGNCQKPQFYILLERWGTEDAGALVAYVKRKFKKGDQIWSEHSQDEIKIRTSQGKALNKAKLDSIGWVSQAFQKAMDEVVSKDSYACFEELQRLGEIPKHASYYKPASRQYCLRYQTYRYCELGDLKIDPLMQKMKEATASRIFLIMDHSRVYPKAEQLDKRSMQHSIKTAKKFHDFLAKHICSKILEPISSDE